MVCFLSEHGFGADFQTDALLFPRVKKAGFPGLTKKEYSPQRHRIRGIF
jgi:hypothetical protein